MSDRIDCRFNFDRMAIDKLLTATSPKIIALFNLLATIISFQSSIA